MGMTGGRQGGLIAAAVMALALVLSAAHAPAQTPDRRETLADIRQELSLLYGEIQALRRELSTTGPARAPAGQGPLVKRLDDLELELRRLTRKTEELEFRINRIVQDGTRRIGDLEFRLVELEGGDTSKLGETTTLGGDLRTPPVTPPGPTGPAGDGADMAVSEEADFNAAKQAYEAGDYQTAARLFARFSQTYPGGALAAEALYLRGESLAALGQWTEAAKSYLDSFSGTPDGKLAPDALYRLGVSLDRIGQRADACLTLNEVGLRYPDSTAAGLARDEMTKLECAN